MTVCKLIESPVTLQIFFNALHILFYMKLIGPFVTANTACRI